MSKECNTTELFLIAGEQSGDLHGGLLLHSLNALDPSMKFHGIGGPKMRKSGLQCLIPMEEMQIMGFIEVIKNLPRIRRLFRKTLEAILKQNPAGVIFIDYPGFNLRLAKALRKRGYQGKLIHYICPTIWAWKKKRIHTLTSTLDLLLTIFPFEAPLFKGTSLPVIYVGHPLNDSIKRHEYKTNWVYDTELDPRRPILSVFPGSRKSAIRLNLYKQLDAANMLRKDDPSLAICISIANESLESDIHRAISCLGLEDEINRNIFLVPEKNRYEQMKASRAAIATCGTVTLELALHQVPTVVVYDLSKATAWILNYIFRLKLPFYCIVNILGQRSIFQELIYKDFTPFRVYENLKECYSTGSKRDQCIEGCIEVAAIIQQKHSTTASQKAAQAINSIM